MRSVTLVWITLPFLCLFSPSLSFQFKVVYQLPAPKMEGADDKKLQDMYIMIWALSTILPLAYMGHKEEDKATKVLVTVSLAFTSNRDFVLNAKV